MIALELSCLAIVVVFVAFRAREEPNPRAFVGRLALLAASSWIGEETCIHLYGFYAYSPRWSVFLDVVPLMVVLIWPVVIHSAWDVARRLRGSRPGVPLLAAGLVLADASLIEPIAVAADLWRWTEPGLFGVPPVGILGWSLYALAAIALLERWPLRRPADLAVHLLLPNLWLHATLLVVWWGALRWVSAPVPPTPAVVTAASLSVLLAVVALRGRYRFRVPRSWMLLRVPAASFFFVLLALHAADQHHLVAWSLAFAPPWLALTDPSGQARPGPAP